MFWCFFWKKLKSGSSQYTMYLLSRFCFRKPAVGLLLDRHLEGDVPVRVRDASGSQSAVEGDRRGVHVTVIANRGIGYEFEPQGFV